MSLKKCLIRKCSIVDNSKGLFNSTGHFIFVSVLIIHSRKCDKVKLYDDEPPYSTVHEFAVLEICRVLKDHKFISLGLKTWI